MERVSCFKWSKQLSKSFPSGAFLEFYATAFNTQFVKEQFCVASSERTSQKTRRQSFVARQFIENCIKHAREQNSTRKCVFYGKQSNNKFKGDCVQDSRECMVNIKNIFLSHCVRQLKEQNTNFLWNTKIQCVAQLYYKVMCRWHAQIELGKVCCELERNIVTDFSVLKVNCDVQGYQIMKLIRNSNR